MENHNNIKKQQTDPWAYAKGEKKPKKDYGPPCLIGTLSGMDSVIFERIKSEGINPEQFFQLFQEVEFFDVHRSFAAIEFAFAYFSSISGISEEIYAQRTFLYSAERNVGVMKNYIVSYGAGKGIKKLDHDYCGRAGTFTGCRPSISAFFSRHPGSILAVSVRSVAHNTLVFMQKSGRGFDFVHFNPNFNERFSLGERMMIDMCVGARI